MSFLRTLLTATGRLPARAKIRQQCPHEQWVQEELRRRRNHKEALK